jgi:antitoxin PrlF
MHTAKLKANGQITIPTQVRKALGLNAGGRVEFVLVGPGRYELVAATRDVKELKGMFGPTKKLVSL